MLQEARHNPLIIVHILKSIRHIYYITNDIVFEAVFGMSQAKDNVSCDVEDNKLGL